jgi:hypothetical protein
MKMNAQVTSRIRDPEAEPTMGGEGKIDRRKLTDTKRCSGGALATARSQGRLKQLEKPSSSRGEIRGAGKPYKR